MDCKKSEDLGAQKYLLTFKKVNFTTPEYCSINNLRKLMILNILGCCRMDGLSRIWAMI